MMPRDLKKRLDKLGYPTLIYEFIPSMKDPLKIRLIFIVGPTAVGKSEIGLCLSQSLSKVLKLSVAMPCRFIGKSQLPTINHQPKPVPCPASSGGHSFSD